MIEKNVENTMTVEEFTAAISNACLNLRDNPHDEKNASNMGVDIHTEHSGIDVYFEGCRGAWSFERGVSTFHIYELGSVHINKCPIIVGADDVIYTAKDIKNIVRGAVLKREAN